MPELDQEQNWELLNASQTGNMSTLNFKRIWDTCDDDDVVIDVMLFSMKLSGYHLTHFLL